MKSLIAMKLSYEIEKISVTFAKESGKQLSHSKGGLHIDINNHFSSLKFNLNRIACIE